MPAAAPKKDQTAPAPSFIKQAMRKIISANPECTKGTVVDLAPHGKPAVTKALKLMMLSGEVVNVGEEGERKAWKLVLS